MGLNSPEAGPLLTEAQVSLRANPGSFSKAQGLCQEGAAKILIRCADGSVEGAVRSERGNEMYKVRVPDPGRPEAKCDCHDFRRRGGLCKHGAAVLLALIRDPRCTPPLVPAKKEEGETPRFFERTTEREVWKGERSTDREVWKGKISGGKRPRIEKPESTEDAASVKARRPATPMLVPRFPATVRSPALPPNLEATEAPESRSDEVLEDVPDPKTMIPRFPQPQPQVQAAAAVAKPQPAVARWGAVKASMAARVLRARVAAGDTAGVEAELRKLGDMPVVDPAALLRSAVTCEQEAGAVSVATALLARPEMADALSDVDAATGRTPLHTAVAARRLEVCRVLLAHRADPHSQDGAGKTALELARANRLDTSLRQAEDPIVALIRQVAPPPIQK
eukprot:gnl/TRDRNA2_/TRDRNA2_187287_c0_seq1.p1 gnl/TRDRNA2_/TRDRNA2_187287_c0~~gnl/TRDRNA2_/TRDRNA2_187287_c0_seq1.p1  ORF type:complete len:394 (+),score=56.94 gnl/TRDRNA2_/TRDRNA2_187287_c0_seq1:36-1217(+)